jgi:hypothetical protein
MSAVFVDDYILAAVEDPAGDLLQRTARAALHSIHAIFPPPSRSGHTGGEDPISQKKLEKDDVWAHKKEVLARLPVRRPTPHSKALDCKGQCHRRRDQATTEKAKGSSDQEIPVRGRTAPPRRYDSARSQVTFHPNQPSPSGRTNC